MKLYEEPILKVSIDNWHHYKLCMDFAIELWSRDIHSVNGCGGKDIIKKKVGKYGIKLIDRLLEENWNLWNKNIEDFIEIKEYDNISKEMEYEYNE